MLKNKGNTSKIVLSVAAGIALGFLYALMVLQLLISVTFSMRFPQFLFVVIACVGVVQCLWGLRRFPLEIPYVQGGMVGSSALICIVYALVVFHDTYAGSLLNGLMAIVLVHCVAAIGIWIGNKRG